MTGRKVLFAALALAAFASSAVLVHADDNKSEKKGISYDLTHYFPIRSALAGDKTDVVKDHAEKLAKSEDKAIAKAGEELVKALNAKADDLASARKSFGDLSKALIAEIDAANKKGEKFCQVFVFECTMSKPFGKWVQESKDIANPYQGSKMLTCGKLLGTSGDEKVKGGCCDDEKKDSKKGGCCDDEKKDDNKGHEHHHE